MEDEVDRCVIQTRVKLDLFYLTLYNKSKNNRLILTQTINLVLVSVPEPKHFQLYNYKPHDSEGQVCLMLIRFKTIMTWENRSIYFLIVRACWFYHVVHHPQLAGRGECVTVLQKLSNSKMSTPHELSKTASFSALWQIIFQLIHWALKRLIPL